MNIQLQALRSDDDLELVVTAQNSGEPQGQTVLRPGNKQTWAVGTATHIIITVRERASEAGGR
jgi:hypothetical protein